MDAYSFILGMSSVVVIAIAVVSVVGFFKVRIVKKDLESFQNNFSVEFDNRTKDIYDSMNRNYENTHHRIDNFEKEIFSQLDSRLDKLENKIKNSQKEVLHS